MKKLVLIASMLISFNAYSFLCTHENPILQSLVKKDVSKTIKDHISNRLRHYQIEFNEKDFKIKIVQNDNFMILMGSSFDIELSVKINNDEELHLIAKNEEVFKQNFVLSFSYFNLSDYDEDGNYLNQKCSVTYFKDASDENIHLITSSQEEVATYVLKSLFPKSKIISM